MEYFFLNIVLPVCVGALLFSLFNRRSKPTKYVDNNTADLVIEALYRSGLAKEQISNAMVEMRKLGIIFFRQVD